MDANEQMLRLLEEIRDAQRDHLDEYRRVTQRSLELQQRAVTRQEQMARLYQVVVGVTAIVLLGLGGWLFFFVRSLLR